MSEPSTDRSRLHGSLSALDADESQLLLDDTSDELLAVSGRITGQYAEVLARFAARAFAGGPVDDLDAVREAITSIRRLAEATGAGEQARLLDELDELAGAMGGRPAERNRALARLQAWIPAFADTLPTDQAEHLLRLVRWDPQEQPLLDELRAIRGIGPRRLKRLYAAGLFTIEAVACAGPSEISSVTGIPLELASQVIERSGRYAEEERRRCLQALKRYAARLALLSSAGRGGLEQEVDDLLQRLERLLGAVAPQSD